MSANSDRPTREDLRKIDETPLDDPVLQKKWEEFCERVQPQDLSDTGIDLSKPNMSLTQVGKILSPMMQEGVDNILKVRNVSMKMFKNGEFCNGGLNPGTADGSDLTQKQFVANLRKAVPAKPHDRPGTVRDSKGCVITYDGDKTGIVKPQRKPKRTKQEMEEARAKAMENPRKRGRGKGKAKGNDEVTEEETHKTKRAKTTGTSNLITPQSQGQPQTIQAQPQTFQAQAELPQTLSQTVQIQPNTLQSQPERFQTQPGGSLRAEQSNKPQISMAQSLMRFNAPIFVDDPEEESNKLSPAEIAKRVEAYNMIGQPKGPSYSSNTAFQIDTSYQNPIDKRSMPHTYTQPTIQSYQTNQVNDVYAAQLYTQYGLEDNAVHETDLDEIDLDGITASDITAALGDELLSGRLQNADDYDDSGLTNHGTEHAYGGPSLDLSRYIAGESTAIDLPDGSINFDLFETSDIFKRFEAEMATFTQDQIVADQDWEGETTLFVAENDLSITKELNKAAGYEGRILAPQGNDQSVTTTDYIDPKMVKNLTPSFIDPSLAQHYPPETTGAVKPNNLANRDNVLEVPPAVETAPQAVSTEYKAMLEAAQKRADNADWVVGRMNLAASKQPTRGDVRAFAQGLMKKYGQGPTSEVLDGQASDAPAPKPKSTQPGPSKPQVEYIDLEGENEASMGAGPSRSTTDRKRKRSVEKDAAEASTTGAQPKGKQRKLGGELASDGSAPTEPPSKPNGRKRKAEAAGEGEGEGAESKKTKTHPHTGSLDGQVTAAPKPKPRKRSGGKNAGKKAFEERLEKNGEEMEAAYKALFNL